MSARTGLGLLATFVLSACLLDVEYTKEQPTAFCGDVVELAMPPSCDGAQRDCGPDRNANCCDASAIPCGTVVRDFDGGDFNDDDGRMATVSDFRLDTYEVTVGRFRAFVEDGQGTQAAQNPLRGSGGHPRYLNSGWDPDTFFSELEVDEAALRLALQCSDPLRHTWTDDPDFNENKPINCVSWYEALLFCAWDGGRLPSEVEWYFAAAGGEEQRAYPWAEPASVVDADLAVFGCPDAMVACETGTSIAPVGSKRNGVGRWGHYDLSGNVAEWVLDTVIDATDYVSPCDDCVRIGVGNRGVRGGAFNTAHVAGTVDDLLVASRASAPPKPQPRAHGIGFRCMRPTN